MTIVDVVRMCVLAVVVLYAAAIAAVVVANLIAWVRWRRREALR